MIQVDFQIRELAQAGAIAPFKDYDSGFQEVYSSGLSSCGYDLRLARDFKSVDGKLGDRRNIPVAEWESPSCPWYGEDDHGEFFLSHPGSFWLARTVETLQIPDDVMVLFFDKSSLAREGIITNVTPGEPGWKGHLTLEISNNGPNPVKLYIGQGIIQSVWHKLPHLPERVYSNKRGGAPGKYQGQVGVTLSRSGKE